MPNCPLWELCHFVFLMETSFVIHNIEKELWKLHNERRLSFSSLHACLSIQFYLDTSVSQFHEAFWDSPASLAVLNSFFPHKPLPLFLHSEPFFTAKKYSEIVRTNYRFMYSDTSLNTDFLLKYPFIRVSFSPSLILVIYPDPMGSTSGSDT